MLLIRKAHTVFSQELFSFDNRSSVGIWWERCVPPSFLASWSIVLFLACRSLVLSAPPFLAFFSHSWSCLRCSSSGFAVWVQAQSQWSLPELRSAAHPFARALPVKQINCEGVPVTFCFWHLGISTSGFFLMLSWKFTFFFPLGPLYPLLTDGSVLPFVVEVVTDHKQGSVCGASVHLSWDSSYICDSVNLIAAFQFIDA